jgi:8-hydroxy-5-deazaflavin:NADPH oxidoreductase
MRIGIIGAGMIGSTLAKLWADAGHTVLIASRHPEELEPLAEKLGKNASAGAPVDAAAFGEAILLTVPLVAVPQLASDLAPSLIGKVVLDTGNAYEKRDGAAAVEASRHPKGSAGWAAAMFPGARWVKAFNTVYFKVLEREAHRQNDRVGIPLASDDQQALDVAADLVRDAGFEPVVIGALARGKEFEPNTPPYNTGMTGKELQSLFRQGASAR